MISQKTSISPPLTQVWLTPVRSQVCFYQAGGVHMIHLVEYADIKDKGSTWEHNEQMEPIVPFESGPGFNV